MANIHLTRATFIMVAPFMVIACANTESPAAPADDPVLVAGQGIWSASCASCHGSDGGGGVGPAINGGAVLERFEDPAEEAKLIAEGRGNMPAYAGKYGAEEIDAVVSYTREVLN